MPLRASPLPSMRWCGSALPQRLPPTQQGSVLTHALYAGSSPGFGRRALRLNAVRLSSHTRANGLAASSELVERRGDLRRKGVRFTSTPQRGDATSIRNRAQRPRRAGHRLSRAERSRVRSPCRWARTSADPQLPYPAAHLRQLTAALAARPVPRLLARQAVVDEPSRAQGRPRLVQTRVRASLRVADAACCSAQCAVELRARILSAIRSAARDLDDAPPAERRRLGLARHGHAGELVPDVNGRCEQPAHDLGQVPVQELHLLARARDAQRAKLEPLSHLDSKGRRRLRRSASRLHDGARGPANARCSVFVVSRAPRTSTLVPGTERAPQHWADPRVSLTLLTVARRCLSSCQSVDCAHRSGHRALGPWSVPGLALLRHPRLVAAVTDYECCRFCIRGRHCCRGRNRTFDLRVMSPTSYCCSTLQ